MHTSDNGSSATLSDHSPGLEEDIVKEDSGVQFLKVLIETSEVRHDSHVTESERYG